VAQAYEVARRKEKRAKAKEVEPEGQLAAISSS
jgi:hypothetical protein